MAERFLTLDDLEYEILIRQGIHVYFRAPRRTPSKITSYDADWIDDDARVGDFIKHVESLIDDSIEVGLPACDWNGVCRTSKVSALRETPAGAEARERYIDRLRA